MDIDIHDRVMQAYNGEMGESLMQSTRSRIHWIAQNIKGSKILDVGCSQGILAMLLAREGKNIIAIDISERAIVEAKGYIAGEAAYVKERIDFVQMDFISNDFKDEKFDTIVMAEILEHLTMPEEFIRVASSLIKKDGKLIITVPFGINDFIDHKRTYYFEEMFDTINRHLSVSECEVMGKWIAFVAVEKDVGIKLDKNLFLPLLEKSFYKIERELVDLQKDTSKKLNDVNVKYRETNIALAGVKERVMELSKLLDQEKAEAKEKLNDINVKYRESTMVVANIKQDVLEVKARESRLARLLSDAKEKEVELTKLLDEEGKKANGKINEVSTKCAQAEIEVMDVKRSIDAANQKYRVATASVDALKREVGSLKIKRKLDAEQTLMRIATLNKEVEKTKRTLSYRIGSTIVGSIHPWYKVMVLPVLLVQAVVKYKKAQKNKTIYIKGQDTVDVEKKNYRVEVKANEKEPSIQRGDCNFKIDMNKKLKMAVIMDEFTFSSFSPEGDLKQLSPENWKAELESFLPDMLFIESAWRGGQDLWAKSQVGHNSGEVKGIVAWCKERNIPTVFWNKEDPIHFQTFLNTAKQFDFVFTTDIDCIQGYKELLQHNEVYLLPFAVQPKLHNPIEKYERKDAFCFAGAYYTRYPERTHDLGNFVADLSQLKPFEIYDRNFGKTDKAHMFPEEYKPYIIGTLKHSEIDKAYKGYNYAINLNSVKQSQSMFARRIFELMASNTTTISNFSRGVRMFFGDLAFTSDSSSEIVANLSKYISNPSGMRKLKLLALRKVMSEHTYEDRLNYILSKVNRVSQGDSEKNITVIAEVKTKEELETVIESFRIQTIGRKSLIVKVSEEIRVDIKDGEKITLTTKKDFFENAWSIDDGELVAVMSPKSFYAENYLLDLSLAIKYSDAEVITKLAYFGKNASGVLELNGVGKQYRISGSFNPETSLFRVGVLKKEGIYSSLFTGENVQISGEVLSTDEFNYCRNCMPISLESKINVSDLVGVDQGISFKKITEISEKISSRISKKKENINEIIGDDLMNLFDNVKTKNLKVIKNNIGVELSSILPDGGHEYLYGKAQHTLESLGYKGKTMKIFLEQTLGLNVSFVVWFISPTGEKLEHQILVANKNYELNIPVGTEKVRFGLRVLGSGSCEIKSIVLGERELAVSSVVQNHDHLLITNHYPSYDDLYRNGFVHSRVKAYRNNGVGVDVFRLRPEGFTSYHEFEGVDVTTGSEETLSSLIKNGAYKSIMVHFLDKQMWDVLKNFVNDIEIIVWVHGAEIQPYHRREFNYHDEVSRDKAKQQSKRRMVFWQGVLGEMPKNLMLVFVSAYFKEEVETDLGLKIPASNVRIIHNPIDTDVFNFEEKDVSMRKKILSIRPYASEKYANDLSVKAVLSLVDKPFFKELDFLFIGDGVLFDKTLAPLIGLKNVRIERGFLSQKEISAMHKEYGIFMCPTRMDAQGVSRDEAMSSGLIPVTNAVTAIPEFVDDKCGILAEGESYIQMADGIEMLYRNPDIFKEMSKNASKRVMWQTNMGKIIKDEIDVIQRYKAK